MGYADSLYNKASQGFKLIRVDRYNFAAFDDMIYRRYNNRERASIEKTNARLHGFRDFYVALANPGFFIFAAQKGEKMIGFAAFSYVPNISARHENDDSKSGGHVYLNDFWVDPDCGADGVTEKLVAAGSELVGELGADALRIYITGEESGTAEFLKSAGFAVLHPEMLLEKKASDA